MSNHQVSLFESNENLVSLLDRRVAKMDWSYSKRNVLETCVRKYFYQYYGHKLSNPYLRKDELRFYKKMSNRFLISGDIIHLMIKTYLDNFQSSEEKNWQAERLKKWSKDIIRKYLNFSFNYKKGAEKELKFPPPLIQEMFFEHPDYLELYEEEAVSDIALCIDNFFNYSEFKALVASAKTEKVIVEDNINFLLDEKVRVKGKIDFAFDQGDEFVICDWKTGEVEEHKESLQLFVYALWAVEQKGYDVDAIRLIKGFLKHNKIEEYKFSKKQLFRAKAAIIQSAQEMIEYSEFGEEGLEDAFEPINYKKVCNLCPFQTLCQNQKTL